MNIYQKYSGVYDLFLPNYERFFQVIEETIQEYSHNPQSLLELACGTGNILQHFVNKYEVSGIDISTSMLEQAKKKLPDVPLYEMDMANLKLGRKFDVVVCMYDSINHLLEYKDWIMMFKCVHNHLNPGGVFIFDMNTSERLDRLAQLPGFVQQKEDVYLIMRVNKMADNVVNWNVKIFQKLKDNQYELGEDNIKETSFPPKIVKMDLEKLFAKVHILTFEDEPNSDRIFFACQV
jgi:ubiquinone/menaquinone biosynthesis C-methylase UbiE